MNWKQFKETIEAQGVTDETEINYIDTNMYKPIVDKYGTDGSVHIE